jgi:hypothetical protein
MNWNQKFKDKNLNFTQRFNLYRAVNTHSLSYKNKLDLRTEKKTVCSEIHIKVTNTVEVAGRM